MNVVFLKKPILNWVFCVCPCKMQQKCSFCLSNNSKLTCDLVCICSTLNNNPFSIIGKLAWPFDCMKFEMCKERHTKRMSGDPIFDNNNIYSGLFLQSFVCAVF